MRLARGGGWGLAAVVTVLSLLVGGVALGSPEESEGGTARIRGTVSLDGVGVEATVEIWRRDRDARLRTLDFESRKAPWHTWTRRPLLATAALQTQTSDADGRFVFEGVEPGAYVVRATTSAGVQGSAHFAVDAQGAQAEVNVYLANGPGTLHTRVRRPDRVAVRGWALLQMAEWMIGSRWWRPTGQTWEVPIDEDGHVKFVGLPHGDALLWIVVPDGASRLVGQVSIPSPGIKEVQIPQFEQTVSGRITQEGRTTGLSEATVEFGLWNTHGHLVAQEVRVDASGSFRMRLPSGRATFRAHAPGYLAGDGTSIAIPRPEPITLTLFQAPLIYGRVVAKDGTKPPAGLPVWGLAFHRFGGLRRVSGARTAGDGRFGLAVDSDEMHTVFVLGQGWCSTRLAEVDPAGANPLAATPSRSREERILRVERTARVTGRVRTPDGAPVVGCVVRARATSGILTDLDALESAVTDKAGRFELSEIAPRVPHRLVVRGVGRATVESRIFKLRAGRSLQLDVVSPPARWVTLRLRSTKDTRPIAGVEVQFKHLLEDEDDWPNPVASDPVSKTDAQGRVRLGPLGTGRIAIRIRGTGIASLPHHERFHVLENSATWPDGHEHVLRVEPGLGISGRVTLPDGLEREDVILTLRSEAPDTRRLNPMNLRRAVEIRTIPQGANGAFTFAGLPAGAYHLRAFARKDGHRFEADLKAQAGTAKQVIPLKRVGPDRRLAVRVRTQHGARPVGGRVVLHSFQSNGFESTYEDLVHGDASLHLHTDPASDTTYWIEVFGVENPPVGCLARRIVPKTGETVDITLPPTPAYEGRVLDPSGQPIGGARVMAHPTLGREPKEVSRDASDARATAITGSDGIFRLNGLGPGAYLLSVLPPPTFLEPDPVLVKQASSGLLLRLKPARLPMLVRVLDPEGKPVPGAAISGVPLPKSASLHSSPRPPPRTDEEGRYAIPGNVLEQDISLVVQPPEHLRDVLRTARYSGPARDITLRLARAHPITGVIHDSGGQPVPLAVVYWRPDAEGKLEWQRAQQDGTFTIRDLGPGEVLVWVRPASERPSVLPFSRELPAGIPTRILAGSRDVVLTIQ